jgi:hypothetical protein
MNRSSTTLGPLGTVLVASLLAACGEVNTVDDVDASAADATLDGGDDTSAIDAGVDAGDPDAVPARCDPTKNFGAPEKLGGMVNHPTAQDLGPWLSDDERRIYFSSDRDGGYQLYLAVRSEPDDDFGDPIKIGNLGGTNLNPTLSADEKTIYFDAVRGNTGTYQDVYRATRDAIGDSFGNVTRVDGVAATGHVYDAEPHLGPTGDRLYVVSARPPVGEDLFGIFQASRVGNEFVIEPGVSPRIADGTHPVLSPDERRIYFMRHDGTMATAARASVDDPFGGSVELPAFHIPGSNDQDAPGWIAPDSCAMYFVTNRGTTSQRDIWVSRKPL